MCKKDPKGCKAKEKCLRCKDVIDSNFIVDNDEQNGKLDLNEVDNLQLSCGDSSKEITIHEVDKSFEEEQYIINVKGDINEVCTKV